MNVLMINAVEEIASCFDVFIELRPHHSDKHKFIDQIVLQQKEGYQLAAIVDDKVLACIGYRTMTTLAWGKVIYIDDLIRAKGYGSVLLEYVVDIAKQQNCAQVHLDSGYARHAAHRVYLNHGFELNSHHFSLVIKDG